jgi:protein ImuA
MDCNGTVLWCRRGGELYGPGLSALGLPPERLIVVRAGRERDLLWAMEEGLRSGALAAVVGEPAAASTVVLRRLQLAAEAGGTAAVLLRPSGVKWAPGPALTHWRIGAAPSLGLWPGRPRWRVELVRCRGGGAIDNINSRHGKPAKGSGSWLVEWREEHGNGVWDRPKTHGFAVAAELRHGPAAPPSTWRRAG